MFIIILGNKITSVLLLTAVLLYDVGTPKVLGNCNKEAKLNAEETISSGNRLIGDASKQWFNEMNRFQCLKTMIY